MKKLEIEKTKPTFIISTFKTDIIKVGLVFSISNFFIAKTSLANNWRSFSSSYLALSGQLNYYMSSNLMLRQQKCQDSNTTVSKDNPKVTNMIVNEKITFLKIRDDDSALNS